MYFIIDNLEIAKKVSNKILSSRHNVEVASVYRIRYDEEQLNLRESNELKELIRLNKEYIDLIVPETSMEDENYINDLDLQSRIAK